ncbi:MAG: hypothetical protein ACLP9L_07825 [Thermoguttaceae bacterium]
MIILGYLLSSKTEATRDLGTKVREQEEKWRQQEDRGNLLEKLIKEMRRTDLGEAQAGRVAAEKQMQLERLLRVWAERRVECPLYRLLRRLENAEAIPLDEVNCLPVGEAFQELNQESHRVFLVSGETLSLHEIVVLMTDVLQHAGFNINAMVRPVDPSLFSTEAVELYFDKDVSARENLRMLKLRIVADLEAERKELFRLQCALVGRIAAARRDKLAATPLSKHDMAVPEKVDPGLHMLATVLADLTNEMRLLPETVTNIRQAGAARHSPEK